VANLQHQGDVEVFSRVRDGPETKVSNMSNQINIRYKDGDTGVVLEYHDAPEDEHTGTADAAHALERITEQIFGILMLHGRSPDLAEMDAQLIRHVWTNALRAVQP
jgi:hypothetical protein